MNCAQCGRPLPDAAAFCAVCGSPVAQPPVAAGSVPPPPPPYPPVAAPSLGPIPTATAAGPWRTVPGAPPPARSATRLSGGTLTGAILGLVGALLTIPACALPYEGASAGSKAYAIFTGGPGTVWFSALPVGSMVLAIIAVAFVTWSRSPVQQVAAGMLMAFGVAAILNFLSYAALPSFSSYGTYQPAMGPGGPVGIVSGALLVAGGLIAFLSRGTVRSAG